jgi:hypothetical protein
VYSFGFDIVEPDVTMPPFGGTLKMRRSPQAIEGGLQSWGPPSSFQSNDLIESLPQPNNFQTLQQPD